MLAVVSFQHTATLPASPVNHSANVPVPASTVTANPLFATLPEISRNCAFQTTYSHPNSFPSHTSQNRGWGVHEC